MPSRLNSRSTLDYLGTIGSTDRGDGMKMNNTAKALVQLADFLMTRATENMDRTGSVATGGIISSMTAKDIQINGSKMELDIEIDSRYKFIDAGVKGTEGGSSRKGYAFKNNRPGKKMALAILKWIKVRGVATKYKALSRNERKNQRIKKISNAAESQKSLAYAMATNIKKKGIKGTRFFSDAVRDTDREKKNIISGALKLDIIEALNS